MTENEYQMCLESVLDNYSRFEDLKGTPMPEKMIKMAIKDAISLFAEDGDNIGYYEDQLLHDVSVKTYQTFKGEALADQAADHIEWLEQRKNDIKWDHWKYYCNKVLKDKQLSMRGPTNDITGLIEDPTRPGPWDNRGLVVGDVQAGKTGNYIGVMAKAADAGYKVLIVLAGITNDLRMQTQERIEDGLLGYNTSLQNNNGIKHTSGAKCNVTIHARTNRDPNGDYKAGANKGFFVYGSDCVLYVVKKNVSILRNIYVDLMKNMQDGEKISAPLLLIDDEADNASINGKQQHYDPVTKNLVDDKEIDPAAINKFIRAILACFSRCSYIGYTATPYANIFGMPGIEKDKVSYDSKLKKEILVGEDLFPRNYIYYLISPPNYFGPERIFGLSEDHKDRLPTVININHNFPNDLQYDEKNKIVMDEMPESMKYAINCFIIAAIGKGLRKTKNIHDTMLINVNRLTNEHDKVYRWVFDYVDSIKQLFYTATAMRRKEYLGYLKSIWENEFVKKESQILQMVDDPLLKPLSWEDIESNVSYFLTERLEVAMVNGTKDAKTLNYRDYKETGKHVIAVGGDKLSRGLTLEGLSISYFLRSSSLYDSLTQMGRWFGYRDGYIDLCRLFAPANILKAFSEIALSNYDLHQQFSELRRQKGKTPQDFGLRVRTSPDSSMMVTALNKSRNTKKEKITFAGYTMSTAYLPKEAETNANNARIISEFLEGLGSSKTDASGHTYWNNVPANVIINNFLDTAFTVDGKNTAFTTAQLSEYISLMVNKHHELTNWTVFVVNGKTKEFQTDVSKNVSIMLPYRTASETPSYWELNKRRAPSGLDEAFDLTEEQFKLALERTNEIRKIKGEPETTNPGAAQINGVREKNQCLLLLYFFRLKDKSTKNFIEGIYPAFAMCFPNSEHQDAYVSYINNSVAIAIQEAEKELLVYEGDF